MVAFCENCRDWVFVDTKSSEETVRCSKCGTRVEPKKVNMSSL